MSDIRFQVTPRTRWLVLAAALVVALQCSTARADFRTSASFLGNWTAVRTVVGIPDETQRTLTDVLPLVFTPTSETIGRVGASEDFVDLGTGQRVGARAESSGFATASHGLLHTFARAFAGAGPFSGGGPPLFTAYASASFGASFNDNITLGGGLPVGTPVLFDFTWGYHSELTPEPSMLVNIFNPAVTGVQASLLGPDGLAVGGFRTSNDFSHGNSTSTFRVAAHAGDELFIAMSLGSSAFVRAEFSGSQLAIADASHTAFMYLDPVTPGLKIESFSGHDYSTLPNASPVPEPATLTMLAIGLCAVAARRRFKPTCRPKAVN